MIRPTDRDSDENNLEGTIQPPEERPLPEGFPDRPDPAKVKALRRQMKNEQQARRDLNNNSPESRYTERFGKRARDIGSFTLIPMIMLAGPIVGYGVGWIMEEQWGGAPWTGVIGLFMGVVASFRQVIILLTKKTKDDKANRGN